MRRGVLWDSSAILALLDADDADHDRACAVAHRIAMEARPSFITNYIEAEAHALLLRKLGRIYLVVNQALQGSIKCQTRNMGRTVR